MARNTSGLRRGGPGRPKGSKNRDTTEVREFCRTLCEDFKYRQGLLKRLRAGKCAPALETMLWDRAFGKVQDVIRHEGGIEALEVILTDAFTPPPDTEPGVSESEPLPGARGGAAVGQDL